MEKCARPLGRMSFSVVDYNHSGQIAQVADIYRRMILDLAVTRSQWFQHRVRDKHKSYEPTIMLNLTVVDVLQLNEKCSNPKSIYHKFSNKGALPISAHPLF